MEETILSNYVPALRSELFVIALNKGGFFFINQFIPKGIEEFAEVDFKDNSNSVRLVAYENLILVVDKIHNSNKGARNLRFVWRWPNATGFFHKGMPTWMATKVEEIPIPKIHATATTMATADRLGWGEGWTSDMW